MSIKKLFFLSIYFIFFAFLLNSKAQADLCQDTKTICIQDGGTRYFDDVAVTLPCWQYQITRNCGAITDDNCKQLRAQGCVQINSKCRTMLGDICVVQDETYNCPEEQCSDTDGIVCGGEFFCMNGDCSEHNPVLNKNFGKDVSAMAGVASAAQDIKDTNGVKAFGGQALECSEDMVGFKNCCADSGWGKDLDLAHCDDEEKALGKNRENKLTVYIGEYCHNDVPIIGCTSYHEVYCSFGSKLARIVQEQGRRDQLHISFGNVGGDDSYPDCRGITPDELSHIDFGKIKFDEIYDDIKNNTKFPDPDPTTQNIMQRVKQFYDQQKKHD